MEYMDIGLVGLGVMGASICLNIESRGYSVLAYNRHAEAAHAFLKNRGGNKRIRIAETLPALVAGVRRPRKILLMIAAGDPVHQIINEICPLLEPGDILIDGGNSNYEDTTRRRRTLSRAGIHYVGMGVSGGESGALHGPALMPGGDEAAWSEIRPWLEAIAAKAEDGRPCCAWIGPDGAGHYVKMVHNGIEYGDMQLICEVYDILRNVAAMAPPELAETFVNWEKGPLKSYLISITADIFTAMDPEGDGYLVDHILDRAGQKGTGKWTAIAALDAGVPLTLITESVYARDLSASRSGREYAPVRDRKHCVAAGELLPQIERALYAAKILSYAQGFQLMQVQSRKAEWNLDLGEIALIWREGCIIRSAFLEKVKETYEKDPLLDNLMNGDYFRECLETGIPALREVVCVAVKAGVPVPALSSALAYYDAYHAVRLPVNLLQAQRDYFGAHRVQRIDKAETETFHYDWEELRQRPFPSGRSGQSGSIAK